MARSVLALSVAPRRQLAVDTVSRTREFSEDEASLEEYRSIQADYDDSVARGRKRWAALLTQIDRYRNDRSTLESELRQRRADYEQRWNEHYATKYLPQTDRTIGLATGSSTVLDAEDKQSVVPTGKAKADYQVDLDPAADTVVATATYGDKDQAREADTGLSLSEILWRQYYEVNLARFSVLARSRAKAKMAELAHVKTAQVTTPATRRVVWFCYSVGESWKSDVRNWTPDDVEFMAILGTANLSSAVYLLIDHVDELGGKIIESIGTLADHWIDVRLGAAPGVDEVFAMRARVLAAADTAEQLRDARAIESAAAFPTDLGRDNPLMSH